VNTKNEEEHNAFVQYFCV